MKLHGRVGFGLLGLAAVTLPGFFGLTVLHGIAAALFIALLVTVHQLDELGAVVSELKRDLAEVSDEVVDLRGRVIDAGRAAPQKRPEAGGLRCFTALTRLSLFAPQIINFQPWLIFKSLIDKGWNRKNPPKPLVVPTYSL